MIRSVSAKVIPVALVALGGVTMAAFIYLAVAFFVGLPPLDDDGSSPESEVLAATATRAPPAATSTPDMGLDLEIISAGGCMWKPTSAAGAAASVHIQFSVKNSVGRYLGPISVGSPGHLNPGSQTFDTENDVEWTEIYATNSRYFTETAQVDASEDALGATHEVVLAVDPANEIPELDETNNVITVVVGLPDEPPTEVGGEVILCQPPGTAPVPATPTP